MSERLIDGGLSLSNKMTGVSEKSLTSKILESLDALQVSMNIFWGAVVEPNSQVALIAVHVTVVRLPLQKPLVLRSVRICSTTCTKRRIAVFIPYLFLFVHNCYTLFCPTFTLFAAATIRYDTSAWCMIH